LKTICIFLADVSAEINPALATSPSVLAVVSAVIAEAY
jgi:hypothetical protein